jgi:hypothetical protein
VVEREALKGVPVDAWKREGGGGGGGQGAEETPHSTATLPREWPYVKGSCRSAAQVRRPWPAISYVAIAAACGTVRLLDRGSGKPLNAGSHGGPGGSGLRGSGNGAARRPPGRAPAGLGAILGWAICGKHESFEGVGLQ